MKLSDLLVSGLPYLFCCSFREAYFIMAHKFIEVKDILEILYINQNTTGNAVVKITKEKKNKIKWTTNKHLWYSKKKKKLQKNLIAEQ